MGVFIDVGKKAMRIRNMILKPKVSMNKLLEEKLERSLRGL